MAIEDRMASAPLPPQGEVMPEDIMEVELAEAQALDETVAGNAPTGRFGKTRLSALARSINSFNKLIGAPEIETTFEDIKDGPLPEGLFRAIMAIESATGDYTMAEGDEENIHSFGDLNAVTRDKDLAAISAKITKLVKDKDFKKFLQTDAPEEAPVEEVVEEVAVEEEAPTEEAALDLAALGF